MCFTVFLCVNSKLLNVAIHDSYIFSHVAADDNCVHVFIIAQCERRLLFVKVAQKQTAECFVPADTFEADGEHEQVNGLDEAEGQMVLNGTKVSFKRGEKDERDL